MQYAFSPAEFKFDVHFGQPSPEDPDNPKENCFFFILDHRGFTVTGDGNSYQNLILQVKILCLFNPYNTCYPENYYKYHIRGLIAVFTNYYERHDSCPMKDTNMHVENQE